MLSNYVISNQKFVLIIDELNRERIAQKFIAQLLSEQKDDPPSIDLTLPNGSELKDRSIFLNMVINRIDQSSGDHSDAPLNVILPTLADWLNYAELSLIFRIIRKIRQCAHVRRVFLWISPQHIKHTHADYVLACFKHLAELVVHIESAQELSIITRRPGGSVSNKRYNCVMTKTEFLVTPTKAEKDSSTAAATQKSAESPKAASDTFKIELEEDEVVARNALTLPYEKTSQTGGGAIICTPENRFYSDDSEDEEEDWTNMYQ